MKKKSSYSETLQDPRWQRKRLSVLERAGWLCEWCGAAESPLQVHHGYYGKTGGRLRAPWEVPEDVLYCLCDPCHERAELARQSLYLELGRIHPKHHWHVRQLLHDVQRLIEQDDSILQQAVVEKA